MRKRQSTWPWDSQDLLRLGTPSATRSATWTPPTSSTKPWTRFCGRVRFLGIPRGWPSSLTARWPSSSRSTSMPTDDLLGGSGEGERGTGRSFGWPGIRLCQCGRHPPEVDEEEEISAEREEVINAIGAFFRTADENSCIKCGQSGHAEYDCKAKGSDDVKNALNKLRDILAKKRVEAEERQEKDGAEEDQQQEREKSKHPSGKQDESMYSTPLTLIDIGNRVHGARVDRDCSQSRRTGWDPEHCRRERDGDVMRVGHGCTCCVRPPGVQEVEHQDSHCMPQNSTDLWRHLQGNNRRRQRTPIHPRWQQREWVPLHGQLGNQPSPQSQQSPTTSCWKTLGEGLNRHFPGLRCDEAAWVDIHGVMENRQPHGTYDRTPQIKQLIRMQWTEYQRKRRVRWQFLCYALNETFTVPDDFLVGELVVDTVMQRLIPEDGSGIYLGPSAIRDPSAHWSRRPGSLKLELGKDPAFVDIRIHRDVQVLLPRHWDQEPRHDSRRATAWGETRR